MLDYFGQSPIIVRSSRCWRTTSATPSPASTRASSAPTRARASERLEDFLSAVRTIYASTMSEKALRYRAQRGLLDRDEQMALLVQRVSGAMHGRSSTRRSPAWASRSIPTSGTRTSIPRPACCGWCSAWARAPWTADDDYTRVVALNAPRSRPEANFEEVRQYAQRRWTYLDLEANQLVSGHFLVILIKKRPDMPLLTSSGRDRSQHGPRPHHRGRAGVPTFDRLLRDTDFVQNCATYRRSSRAAYQLFRRPRVHGELYRDGAYKISLLQVGLRSRGCDGRPAQVYGKG